MTSIENTSSAHSVRSTQPEDFDLVILGGGTGSTVAAWTFAAEGNRVAVIDRKYIGGSCPAVGALPPAGRFRIVLSRTRNWLA